jgi:Trk K+ transport system NAD-binding subunit
VKNDLKELGVTIVEHTVAPNGVDDRKTVQQFVRDGEAQSLVLAIRKADGTLVQHPPGTHRLEASDVVMMLSH